MVRNSLLFIILLSSSFVLSAQTDRYIVFLKDKANTPFSISDPEQFLSKRAIQRRSSQKIEITAEDLPINPAYAEQLRTTGAGVYFSSRWMNCILVETTPAIISVIQSQPFVSKTELVAPGKKLASGRIKKFKKRNITSATPATNSQLAMIGIDSMQLDGLLGEGISIAVFDSGFEGVDTALPFKSIFEESRLSYSFDFIANSKNVFQYDDHGTEVFSVIAAYSPGSFAGGAYKATYTLFVTEDVGSEYRIEEYNWLFAAEKADSAGVDVINSSLGYNEFDDPSMNYKASDLNGATAVISLAARKAFEKGMLVVCSAGNEGSNSWKFVTPPADAEGVLAIGSVGPTASKSSFSSIGPTADGRIKPDVMALGSGTSVINPNGSLGAASGTSLASPLIASLAAGLWQRYPYLTSAELSQAIISSADQFLTPDNLKGYGIPNYNAVRSKMDTLKLDEDIAIYPNPTKDSIRIMLKKAEGKTVAISIHNLQGQLVSEYSVLVIWQNNPLLIDLASLSAGLYLVKVNINNLVKTLRLHKL